MTGCGNINIRAVFFNACGEVVDCVVRAFCGIVEGFIYAVRVFFFEEGDVFFKAKVMLYHVRCVCNANITEVPILAAYLSNALVIFRIAENKAVFSAVCCYPSLLCFVEVFDFRLISYINT